MGNQKKERRVLWVEIIFKYSNIGGADRIIAIIRDIDQKKKNELELDRYRKHLEVIVSERTLEINNVNAKLHSINEELHTANTELSNANNNLEVQKNELTYMLETLSKTQDQLIESEKMASIGILAAGVAHEINNPLNFIQAGLWGLQNYFEESLPEHIPNVNVLIEGIETGITRASNIVTSLNHFSRQNTKMDEICNIHAIIDNCLVMLQNNTKHRISITKEFTKEIYTCHGNEGKLHQVFLNILSNAIQAIVDEGKIAITTIAYKNTLTIKISDTGYGINAENMNKIINPFFTTKEPGKGTGLGLAISHRIITDHKGELKFRSETGKGTSVYIYLPIL
ncbi:MAG: GHKL domain-containing protein [Bacteroidales bacterium]|nr:GHKL domain-containing protein [Bacteroidales bacterium]